MRRVTRVTLLSFGAFVAALTMGTALGGAATHARVDAPVGGRLDPAFASGGTMLVGFSASTRQSTHGAAVAVQHDGKIVVAATLETEGASLQQYWGPAEIAVARLTDTGAYDSGFATKGVFRWSGAFRSSAGAVALQPDGKIVVAGESGGSLTLLRLTSSGALDPSFGAGGVAKLGVLASPESIAIDPRGRIVGLGIDSGNTVASFVFRVSPEGTFDRGFGTAGIVRTGPVGGLAVQADAKVVIATWGIARYLETGALDPSFGKGGVVSIADGRGERLAFASVATTPTGKILAAVAGLTAEIFRLRTTGSVDLSFGAAGSVSAQFPTSDPLNRREISISEIASEGRGGFVVGGSTGLRARQIGLARFMPGGAVDNKFGDSGVTVTDVGGTDPEMSVFDLARAADGKLVALGSPRDQLDGVPPFARYVNPRFTLARYLPRSCSVPSLVKQMLAAAKAALRQAGCPLGSVRYVRTRKLLRGLVTVQQPAAGSSLPSDGAVDLAVGARRGKG